MTLWWQPGEGSTSRAFEVELDGQIHAVDGIYLTVTLEPGTHSWRVRATGPWTEIRSFEVQQVAYLDNVRTAFFDDIVAKTKTRTAWSPVKGENLGTTYDRELDLHNLRAEFAVADDETKMLRALLKLHNIQKDSHLALEAAQRPLLETTSYAPIRFYPDMSDFTDMFLFVANFSDDVHAKGVERGDMLVAVNGIPVPEYIRWLDPSVQYSTRQNGYFRYYGGAGATPGALSAKTLLFDPDLYEPGNAVTYTLEDRATGELKEVAIEYSVPPGGRVEWRLPAVMGGSRSSNPKYYEAFYQRLGFSLVSSPFPENQDAALWIKPQRQLAILEWFDFENATESVADILQAACAHNALDYDLIIDSTHASGGSGSPYLVAILTDEPFRPTFGNVRTTDRAFVEANMDMGPRVSAWIQNALDRNADYTTDEPFKLQYPEIMEPAPTRFTGKKVLLMFPWGGSQVDQFAAIVVDNHGSNGIHTMGTTMGGYSNTWEWMESDLPVPGLASPLVLEWNIGHTIRPNGEVLEGNPAEAAEWIPFTRDNASTYFEVL